MPQTGATRYQKFLKSEKNKTKLKSKKELPKGTNVTKTNFKVKKIVILEQLKKHGANEALSTRKLNATELLSRINHFNTHSRKDALTGLKELITAHPEVLDQNLGQLILGITPQLLNIEKVVRRETLEVLHVVLFIATLEKVEPFFDIMSTYLRSAMTHIDHRIQEDSLLFLDILLLCTPSKVSQDFHKIAPNFLVMISKLKVDKPGRTLTVNMDSKITSVEWRVKVLHRLQDFLRQYVEHLNKNIKKTSLETTQIVDLTKKNHFNLFNPNYTSVCQLSCFSAKSSQDTVQIDEAEKFKEYIETLMPLLFETWVEVCPNVNSDQNIETVVSEDAAVLLKHTLEVINLILELVQYFNKKNPSSMLLKTFCQTYKQSFNQHFVHAFPFVTNVRSRQPKAGCSKADSKEAVTDPKLVTENLEICHLFIKLNPFINVKNHNREISSILNYIEKTFNQNTEDVINNAVIKILHTIFSNEITSWTKTLSIMDALFRKIIWAYFNKDMPNSFKQKIFTLLCKIALNDKLEHFHNSEAYGKWLINIPDILLENTVNVPTIDIIHKFAVRNNYTFNAVVKPKLIKIINNLPNLIITDAIDDTSSYHKLFSILYWIKNWDNESFNLLQKQLMENLYRSDHGNYIFDTLRLSSGVL